jgi:two-component system sensor histidine kinase KdpD
VRPSSGEGAAFRLVGDLRPPANVDRDALIAAFVGETASALERTRLEARARRVESLERSDALKTALLSSVSHDLRSPLTAIKAAVGNLRDPEIEWSDDDRDAFLATIEGQTDRLTQTVTNLLDMTRLEGGAVSIRLEPLDVRSLLDEVADEARRRAPERTVHVESSEVGLVAVTADHSLLLQALINLVDNAIRYSTPGGAITLASEKVGRRVLLRVADSGPGIPESDIAHLFEKFYRGRASASARGSGLGLPIVKSMVELCRGTVSVRSSAKGAVFTIDLPAASP